MGKAIKNLHGLRKPSAGNANPRSLSEARLPEAPAINAGPSARDGGSDGAELSRIKAERDALETELSRQKADHESELARLREEFEAELEKLRTEQAELKGNYEWLLEKHRLKAAKIFGRSSERFAVDGQMAIEMELEAAEPAGAQPEPEPEPEPAPEEMTVT